MAQFSVNTTRFDPYKNFKFRVKWEGKYVAAVSKVSTLIRTTDVVEYRDGGDSKLESKFKAQPKYESITLECGITQDMAFQQWAQKALISEMGIRRDIIIEMYNEAGQLAIAYKVFRCWVSKFDALPVFNATGNSIAFQALELENEGWERDDDVNEPSDRG